MAQGDPQLPEIPSYNPRVTGGAAIPSPDVYQPGAGRSPFIGQFAAFSQTLQQYGSYQRSLEDARKSGFLSGERAYNAEQRRKKAEKEAALAKDKYRLKLQGQADRLRWNKYSAQAIAEGKMGPEDDPLVYAAFMETGGVQDAYKLQNGIRREYAHRLKKDPKLATDPDGWVNLVSELTDAFVQKHGVMDSNEWVASFVPLMDTFRYRGDQEAREAAEKRDVQVRFNRSVDTMGQLMRSYTTATTEAERTEILSEATLTFGKARMGHHDMRAFDEALIESFINIAVRSDNVEAARSFVESLKIIGPDDAEHNWLGKKVVQNAWASVTNEGGRLDQRQEALDKDEAVTSFRHFQTYLTETPKDIWHKLDTGQFTVDQAYQAAAQWEKGGVSRYEALMAGGVVEGASLAALRQAGVEERGELLRKIEAKAIELKATDTASVAIEEAYARSEGLIDETADMVGLSVKTDTYYPLSTVEYAVEALTKDEGALNPETGKSWTKTDAREAVDRAVWRRFIMAETDDDGSPVTTEERHKRIIFLAASKWESPAGKEWIEDKTTHEITHWPAHADFDNLEGSNLEEMYKLYVSVRKHPAPVAEELLDSIGFSDTLAEEVFEAAYDGSGERQPLRALSTALERARLTSAFSEGTRLIEIPREVLDEKVSVDELFIERGYSPDGAYYAGRLLETIYSKHIGARLSPDTAFKKAKEETLDLINDDTTAGGTPVTMIGGLAGNNVELGDKSDLMILDYIAKDYIDARNHEYLTPGGAYSWTSWTASPLSVLRRDEEALDRLRVQAGYYTDEPGGVVAPTRAGGILLEEGPVMRRIPKRTVTVTMKPTVGEVAGKVWGALKEEVGKKYPDAGTLDVLPELRTVTPGPAPLMLAGAIRTGMKMTTEEEHHVDLDYMLKHNYSDVMRFLQENEYVDKAVTSTPSGNLMTRSDIKMLVLDKNILIMEKDPDGDGWRDIHFSGITALRPEDYKHYTAATKSEHHRRVHEEARTRREWLKSLK